MALESLHYIPQVNPEAIKPLISTCLKELTPQQWRNLAEGLVDSAVRDQLARLCNTLVRFFTKAVLDPIVWKTTKDWASYKSQSSSKDVAYYVVSPDSIQKSLARALLWALTGIFGLEGWKLEELKELTLHMVNEVAERARSVIYNIMSTQSSIPRGFKSDFSVNPETMKPMVFCLASVLQGYLAYTIESCCQSSSETQLTKDFSSATGNLWRMISGGVLDNVPVEPYLYVYTDGWKHDHESGTRGLFEINRRESQAEESHKLRLLIQQSLAEPVPAPVSVAGPTPTAAPSASTKKKSLWKRLVGKRCSKVSPLGVPTASTPGISASEERGKPPHDNRHMLSSVTRAMARSFAAVFCGRK